MKVTISAEKALFIDKLLRTTKASYIVFEIDIILQLILTIPDLSQMTIIKFEPQFFDSFINTGRLIVSTPMKKFYERNMKELYLEITEEQIVFEYHLPQITFKKSYHCLHPDIFDLSFNPKFQIGGLDMNSLKRVLSNIKDKEIQVQIGKTLTFKSKTMEVSIDSEYDLGCEATFLIDFEKLKNILFVGELFYEPIINIPEDITPINFAYKLPDVLFTTFISVEVK